MTFFIKPLLSRVLKVALATETLGEKKVFAFHFFMRFMFEMRGDGCVGDNRTDGAAAAAALIRLPVASFFGKLSLLI